MNELQESGTLADLTSFINSNTFGRLKTQITTALLNAAMTDGKFFAIPNNHVITTGFTLMKIKKATARDTYGFSPAELLALRSEHEARELIGDEHYDECVEILTDCRYEDIAFYEAQGCYVNVIATPVVDAEEAFLAAFAVANAVDDLKTGAESVSIHRAMQFIYALNTDVKLHNLLQFGFDSANYIRSVDPQTGAVTVTREGVPENDTYVIDLFYAGDQFLSYYIGDWNETAAKNGGLHNASTDHPIVPPVPEEPVQDPVVDGE